MMDLAESTLVQARMRKRLKCHSLSLREDRETILFELVFIRMIDLLSTESVLR
jgi:hypothetical protein